MFSPRLAGFVLDAFAARPDAPMADPELDQFRWMIEELRVSLFAQELRTPVPVSAKRLQKFWDTKIRG